MHFVFIHCEAAVFSCAAGGGPASGPGMAADYQCSAKPSSTAPAARDKEVQCGLCHINRVQNDAQNVGAAFFCFFVSSPLAAGGPSTSWPIEEDSVMLGAMGGLARRED